MDSMREKFKKKFNVNGMCIPEKHYMVDISQRLKEIETFINNGEYFTINRGRQYGKTTALYLLKKIISKKYTVFSISFEGMGEEAFADFNCISHTFLGLLYDTIDYGEVSNIPETIEKILLEKIENQEEKIGARELSNLISKICQMADKPVVLIIDEVDQAGNYNSFLEFLGVLRNKYLKREERPAFQSVILASVYDIKNLKLQVRKEKEHQYNSPWNIAAKFEVDMSFSKEDIKKMLEEYEEEQHTGMDMQLISETIYDYTSGYPYLVSEVCKIIDEKLFSVIGKEAWKLESIHHAVGILLSGTNTLFDDIRKKLNDFPELKKIFYEILYMGREFPYNHYNYVIDIASMLGYIVDNSGKVAISNRIFETWLYNLFVSEESLDNLFYKEGAADKNQFVVNGHLDMELVLKRFIVHFTDVYGNTEEKFIEETGRKYFLFYLKPIINGTGNYYVEARTRDNKRTDVIVDYYGEKFVVEMKIWHGNEYNKRGEQQLVEYLDAYHKNKGYMLSFNFNQNKQIGVYEIVIGDKILIEAVV